MMHRTCHYRKSPLGFGQCGLEPTFLGSIKKILEFQKNFLFQKILVYIELVCPKNLTLFEAPISALEPFEKWPKSAKNEPKIENRPYRIPGGPEYQSYPTLQLS